MKRAIVIYVEDKYNLLIQTWGLYKSFKYINSFDTDLVVFGTQTALDKLPNDIIKIAQDPITKTEKEFDSYYYINSVACLHRPGSEILDNYDFILRSDVDTFLTPAWSNFDSNKYSVGTGAYSNDDSIRTNLTRIAKIFGIDYTEHLRNIGSTHYGSTEQIKSVAILQTQIVKYLINDEFKINKGAWPSWYVGVSSLYGGDIAVNHIIGKDTLMMDFDYQSTSSNSIHQYPHVHCWHTRNRFSKFDLVDGLYDNIDINSLNLNIIKDYCLFMGLTGKQQFEQHLQTIT